MKRLKIIPQNPNHLLMMLLGVWFVLNILQGIFTELANDEAYYWMIFQNLSWGYFDHPPLSGLLTWLGMNILGESEIGIRFFTILLQPIYLYLFWTVVRTEKSDWRSALIYFLVAFSIPQLQLYGWVVTPDAPLLITTALLLWSYNRYLRNSDIWAAVLIGVSIALLAYAKYQGALVVLFLVASNLRLLRQWRFYVAGAVAALLIVPHILWQYDHDWVSFRYHLSDRNGVFAMGDLFEFLLNVIVTFHPFIFIPFVIYQLRDKAENQMDRALRFMTWGFLVFFVVSTFRGYVQPQWVLPMVFGIIYTTVRSAERYARFQRYILRVGWISFAIFFAFRILSITVPTDSIKFEVFNNHRAYGELADTMEGKTLLFDGHYAQASKMNYYSNGSAIAYPSMYRRSSHYEMMDLDDKLYGQTVAVVVNNEILNSNPKDTLDKRYKHFKIENSMGFYYDTLDNYIPTRRVEIKYTGLPTNTLTKRPVTLILDIHNPYQYDIPLANFKLIGQFKYNKYDMYDVVIPWGNLKILESGSTNKLKVEFIVPEAASGKYRFGMSIQRPPSTSWYNSPRSEIYISNPRQKQGL